MERAKLMFGCYRRGDANDPETYVAACTSVLSRYSAEIVKSVTDPYSGLPSRKSENGWSGLPDVADVKAACEVDAAYEDRLLQLATLPAPDFNRKRLPRPPAGPGAFATVYVPPDAPQYANFVGRTSRADPREWRHDGSRPGLWVAWSWFEKNDQIMHAFKPFTDEELLARYSVKRVPPVDDQQVPF